VQPRRKKQLITKTITVPANLQRACDDFNAGRFYESHEHLEEIWQYERGEVRDAYKGLIQIAAAFVHLSRGKYVGAERLLRTATAYLEPFRTTGALGFDIENICIAARDMHARVLAAGAENIRRLDLAGRPVFAFDAERLRADALRRLSWGFDPGGRALPMEITIAG